MKVTKENQCIKYVHSLNFNTYVKRKFVDALHAELNYLSDC